MAAQVRAPPLLRSCYHARCRAAAGLPTTLQALLTHRAGASHCAAALRHAQPDPPHTPAQCLEHLAGGVSSSYGSEQPFAARYPFLQAPDGGGGEGEGGGEGAGAATASADRALLLQFALRLMLYQPSSAKGPSNPLAAAQARAAAAAGRGGAQPMDVDSSAAAAGGAAAAGAPAGPPPGMSRQDVAAVEGKAAPTGAQPPRQQSERSRPAFTTQPARCWLAACHSRAAPPQPPPSCPATLTAPPALPARCLRLSPPQARRCSARSWACSTSRQLPAWTPRSCCPPTSQPPATPASRCGALGPPACSVRRFVCAAAGWFRNACLQQGARCRGRRRRPFALPSCFFFCAPQVSRRGEELLKSGAASTPRARQVRGGRGCPGGATTWGSARGPPATLACEPRTHWPVTPAAQCCTTASPPPCVQWT